MLSFSQLHPFFHPAAWNTDVFQGVLVATLDYEKWGPPIWDGRMVNWKDVEDFVGQNLCKQLWTVSGFLYETETLFCLAYATSSCLAKSNLKW